MNEDYKNMRELVSEAIKYGKGKYANDWEGQFSYHVKLHIL